MPEWTNEKPKRRRKYRPVLDDIKREQPNHGRAWAEIARFKSEPSGRACAYQLKEQFTDEGFEFRSALDQETRYCVVYARWSGGNDE